MISGNVIPQSWYKHIKTPSGRSDTVSITILSEIVYWYRPKENGHKKFKGEHLQLSYHDFEERFGFNKCTVRSAIKRLECLGIIKTYFKSVRSYGRLCTNVMHITLNYTILKDISSSPLYKKLQDKNLKIGSTNTDTKPDTKHELKETDYAVADFDRDTKDHPSLVRDVLRYAFEIAGPSEFPKIFLPLHYRQIEATADVEFLSDSFFHITYVNEKYLNQWQKAAYPIRITTKMK